MEELIKKLILQELKLILQEKKLTAAQKTKKEKAVKGMKKSKEDFEKRYGERGEEVMYATATKMAQKKAKKKK